MVQVMKAPTHLSRTLLIGAFVAALGGWTSCPTYSASVCRQFGEGSAVAKKCCCGEDCHCGPACGAPIAPSNGYPQAPSSELDGSCRDLLKSSVALARLFDVQLLERQASETGLPLSADSVWPQTLVAKHTCLQV